ncbi:MAG: Rieske (2Fe-2S) protein [Myxococcales bacterium]|nr:Rieske (2Fe-2S) protein [Myxococcales bacterium]
MTGGSDDGWRLVCPRSELRAGVLRQVFLGRNEMGIPVSVLVGVSRDGDLYAYENLCKHLPIPLDGGSGDFFAGDPDTLRCGTHGALYRVSDGFCTRGPCRGTFLHKRTLREQEGEVWLRVE